MRKGFKRVLAFILSLALVLTTFGSDFANTKVYAVEDTDELAKRIEENEDEDDSIFEYPDEDTEEDSDEEADDEEADDEEADDEEDASADDEEDEETGEAALPEEGEGALNDESGIDSSQDISEEAAEEASEEASAESSEMIEKEEETVKEKLVTVTYKATKGGKVSASEETVDINNEDAEFSGATAIPWNDNYTFAGWTDEDGAQVCAEATFVPCDVKEDVTYTANFIAAENIAELMPAVSIEDNEVGDLIVSVTAEEGLFPAGTKIVAGYVDDETALEKAQEVKKNATSAKAVDIKFMKGEEEFQPADAKFVQVSITLKETIEGESFAVLHEHGGEVKEISDADVSTKETKVGGEETTVATGAEFEINEFSIFIIVGEGNDNNNTQREVATYRFYDVSKEKAAETGAEPFYSKLVKKDDVIANVGIPTIPANHEFAGWYIDGNNTKPENKVEFKDADSEYPDGKYTVGDVTAEAVVDIYPVFSVTYYVTFIGTDGEIWRVDAVHKQPGEDLKYNFDDDQHKIPAAAGRAFKGWAKEKNGTTIYKEIDLGQEAAAAEAAGLDSIYLFAVTVKAYWIRFEGNGSGSTFTGPVYLEENEKLGNAVIKSMEANGNPTRKGYKFKGWSRTETGTAFADENGDKLTSAYDDIISTIPEAQEKMELYLYGTWKAEPESSFSIAVWYQSVEGGNNYDYAYSKKIEGVSTDSTITTSFSNNTITVAAGTGANRKTWSTNNVADNSGNTVGGIKNTDTNKTDIGFAYDTTLGSRVEIKDSKGRDTTQVKADGGTIVNVYVQRRKVTITFQLYDYKYTATTSTSGTQYGLVNGTYVPLTRHGYPGSRYWTYGNGIRYDGTRYTRSYSKSWNEYKKYERLYGQKFDSQYPWPSEYDWYDSHSGDTATGSRTTFLDTFLRTHTLYATGKDNNRPYMAYHFKQNLEGEYTLDITKAANATPLEDYGFDFTNKYTGFNVARYLSSYSLNNTSWRSWPQCHDPRENPNGPGVDTIDENQNLYILHERKKFDLTIRLVDPVTGDITEDKISGIPYEQVLKNVNDEAGKMAKIVGKTYAPEKDGYGFDWYKGPEGEENKKFSFDSTMPDGGAVVYGVYKPVKYEVVLHPEGGEYINQLLNGINAGKIHLTGDVATFEVDSTEPVERNNLITGVKKDGFELIGWYIDNKTEFKYGRITKKTVLYAHWRYQGVIKLVYRSGENGSFTNGNEFIPEYSYGTNTSAVAAAPPKANEGYSFVGWEVTGIDNKTYLPNEVFHIDTDVINANNGEKVTVGDEEFLCVVITAKYADTGSIGGEDEKTAITLHPNAPTSEVTASTVPTGFESIGNKQYKREGLLVNQKLEAALGAVYNKKGYIQTSWNTQADGSGLKVKLTDIVAADNINKKDPENPKANILYAIYTPVTLTVKVKGLGDEKDYNGQSQECKGFEVVSATYTDADGNLIDAIDSGEFSASDVEYTGDGAVATNVARDASGNVIVAATEYLDVNDFNSTSTKFEDVDFVIDTTSDDTQSMRLTINPLEVTITTGSDEKSYDGTALTKDEITVTGLLTGETVSYEVTGSQTEVGSSDNTYAIDWDAEGTTAKKVNYNITDELGTLTVTDYAGEITVTTTAGTFTYDGKEHAATVAIDGLPGIYTVETMTSDAKAKDATDEAITATCDHLVIRNSAGDDVTEILNIKYENDTLVINKATIDINTDADDKVYDGKPLTAGGTFTAKSAATTKETEFAADHGNAVKAVELINGEIVYAKITGTQTEVGTSENGYLIDWSDERNTALEKNYKEGDVSKGSLTVTEYAKEIVVTTTGGEFTYDGQSHTGEVQDIKLPEGYTVHEVGTTASVKNVSDGEKTATADQLVIWNEQEKDVTSKLNIKYVNGKIKIKAAEITINTLDGEKTYDGQPLTAAASVTATSGETTVSTPIPESHGNEPQKIDLINGEVVYVTVTGSQTEVGDSQNTYSFDWSKAAGSTALESNYTVSGTEGTLSVNEYAKEIVVTTTGGEFTYDGQSHTGEVQDIDLPDGYTVHEVGTTASVTNVSDGEKTATADQLVIWNAQEKDVTSKLNIRYVNGKIKIKAAEINIETLDGEKTYDGTALTAGATVTATSGETTVTTPVAGDHGNAPQKIDLINGEVVYVTITGTRTEVGNSENTYSFDWSEAAGTTALQGNYTVSGTKGTLTVNEYAEEITVTTTGGTFVYDGQSHGATVEVSPLPKGYHLGEHKSTKTVTNVSDGEVTANAEVLVITNEAGDDVTANLNINRVPGKLQITPASISITTDGETKDYDGTALTKGATVVATSGETSETTDIPDNHANASWKVDLINGETVYVTIKGSQTEIGSSENGYEFDWSEDAGATATESNYTVSGSKGTLTIEENDSLITLTADSAVSDYTGEALTAPTVTPDGLPEGFTLEATATGSITNVSESWKEGQEKNNPVSAGYVIRDANGEDKTANFTNVTTEAGTLVINPLDITLKTGDATKPYDGTALTNTLQTTLTGLIDAEADKVTYTTTGSVTEYNADDTTRFHNNTAVIDWGNVNSTNYTLHEDFGTLTITRSDAKITLTAGSKTKVYDGTPLEFNSVTVGGIDLNKFKVDTHVTGSRTDYGESENVVDEDYLKIYEKQEDGSLVDVTDNFPEENISRVVGVLKVEKASIAIVTDGDEKEYDGTPLTAGATITATTKKEKEDGTTEDVSESTQISAAHDHEAKQVKLVNGEVVYISITGSQTNVGSTKNTYVLDWSKDAGTTAKADNYDVSETRGELNVTNSTAQITLTAADDSKTYDGQPLTNSYVTAIGLPEGFTWVADATGSITNVEDNPTGETKNNTVNDGYKFYDTNGENVTAYYPNVTKVGGQLTINPAAFAIVTDDGEKAYDGSPLTAGAVITDAEGTTVASFDADHKNAPKDVTLVNGETVPVTITGTRTEFGTSDNTYKFDWDAVKDTVKKSNYEISETVGTLEIKRNGDLEIKVAAADDSKTYDGTELTNSKVTVTGLPEGFTYEASATGSITNVEDNPTGETKNNIVDEGFRFYDANGKDQTDNFTNITVINGVLKIDPVQIKIVTDRGTKEYDGTPLTAGAKITYADGSVIESFDADHKNASKDVTLVNGETVPVTITGTQTEIDESDNTYEFDWESVKESVKSSNYVVSGTVGRLVVTENNTDEVVLTAASQSKEYDGQPLTNNEVTVTGLPEGFTYEAVAAGSITNVEDNPKDEETKNNIVQSGYKFYDENGKDQTGSFKKVKTVGGQLTITPKAATVTTGGGSKAYDGTALTNSEGSITGLINGESAVVTPNGAQTEVGHSDNTYDIDFGNYKASNYSITDELGDLWVYANNTEIILTAPSDEKTYDGEALTCDGTGEKKVTANWLPDGFTVVATASGTITDAGSADNTVDSGYEIHDAEDNDKTASFTNIKTAVGTLTVNKAPITVTTGTKEFEYDGTEHSYDDETEIDGIIEKEKASVSAKTNVTVTEVGETKTNTADITWGGVNPDNYERTNAYGTISVAANTTEILLTAASDEKEYDGEPLTNTTVTYDKSKLPEGFKVAAEAGGSITDYKDNADDNNPVKDNYQILQKVGEEWVDKTSSFSGIKTKAGTIKITKKPVTLSTGSQSKGYDGQPLIWDKETELTGIIDRDKDTVTYKTTGSQTEVNDNDDNRYHNNTAVINWNNVDPDNYQVTEEFGTLTVTRSTAEIIITTFDDSKAYDGSPLTSDGTYTDESKVKVTGLPDDFTHKVTVSGTITHVVENDVLNEVTEYHFYDKDGNEKTESLAEPTIVRGKLSITPAELIISTGSKEFDYDGNVHTYDDETEVSGLKGYDAQSGIEVHAIAEVTEYGEEKDNEYGEISWGDVQSDDYDVTPSLGKISVKKNSTAKITVTAPSDEKVYDGKPLTADGSASNKSFVVEGVPEGFTWEAVATGSATNVADSKEGNNPVGTFKILKNGVDKTDSFEAENITKTAGTLTITPAQISIKTDSARKMYDGTPLRAGATVEASENRKKISKDDYNKEIEVVLVNDETATIKLITSITDVTPSTDNDYSFTFVTADKDNYEIVSDKGQLEIYDRGEDAFVVKASVETVDVPYIADTWKDFDFKLTCEAKEPSVIEEIVEELTRFFANLFGFVSHAKMNEDDVITLTPIEGGAEFRVSGVKVKTAERDAGTYTMTMDFSKAKVLDPEDNVVTGQFRFVEDEENMGQLIIERAGVKAHTGSATRVYNRRALTKNVAYMVAADDAPEAVKAELKNVKLKATGTITEVGSTPNTYEVVSWGNVNSENYDVTPDLGTLRVTPDDTGDDPTPIDDDPVPTAATPIPGAVVLGARREESAGDGAAVLGARRGKTEDTTNDPARMLAILIAAAAAITLIVTGKKRDEDQDKDNDNDQ
ncbi:MAG: hypothetical protein K6G10_08880 [Butyrivibrio sp.]|nr:hypothetical protein [Butyrivibrio sp.]